MDGQASDGRTTPKQYPPRLFLIMSNMDCAYKCIFSWRVMASFFICLRIPQIHRNPQSHLHQLHYRSEIHKIHWSINDNSRNPPDKLLYLSTQLTHIQVVIMRKLQQTFCWTHIGVTEYRVLVDMEIYHTMSYSTKKEVCTYWVLMACFAIM